VPLGCDHPLERLWLISYAFPEDYASYGECGPFKKILEMIPEISQIVVDLSSAPMQWRKKCIDEFGRMKLDCIGMTMIPYVYGDHILVFERASVVKEAV
jgi:hypothetical protein